MDCEYLTSALVGWIREKVIASACRGVVMGMSGGLDSSVAAVLCRRSFPQDVLGLVMPCYSCEEDAEHAIAVAGRFDIPIRVVALDGVLDKTLEALGVEERDRDRGRLAMANLKVRLRMPPLYYFANQLGYAVVGSSNRCELALGYFTKYGDGGVDLLPLGNLVKSQVRELARFLDIPQDIIDKPPSAGLWPGQTDEDEMGIGYDMLDRYLLTGEATANVREIIESRMAANAHKRQPPPVAEI
ncbi:MAG: NAD(+) synthase [Dehalococcoidales bacterium]